MDNHIRDLCKRLLDTSGDEEAILLVTELKEALHRHIEKLRTEADAALRPRFVSSPERRKSIKE
jgi:hypothetical protein